MIGVVTDTLKEDIVAPKAMIDGLKKSKLSLEGNIEAMTLQDAPVLVIVNLTTNQEVRIKLMIDITIVSQEVIVAALMASDLSVMETSLKMEF